MSRPADLLLRLGDTTPAWPTNGQISFYAKTDGIFYKLDSNGVETPLIGGGGGSGTVTSIAAAGNNGITVSGSPITSAGTLTFGLGDITPTSVAATGSISGSNLSGTNTGDETDASIKSKLGITTLSGSNTGDQTITLTGDVTGSGTGSFATTLASINADVGIFGSSTLIPVITVDAKGRITSISTEAVSVTAGVASFNTRTGDVSLTSSDVTSALGFTPYNSTNPAGYTSNTGTVTSVNIAGSDGIVVTGTPITTTGTMTLSLGAITPNSVAATGTVTGTNLSGTNTGDQTITLTGDVTGSGTSSFAATLSNTGVVAGSYGSATQVPVFTVDSKGRITGVTNTTITGGSGTVTSVQVSGGTTGLTFTGGPITTSGTITMSGTLDLDNGGTGATTAAGARNAILPTQTGNAGRYLTTDGTNVSWGTISGSGTVTSVALTSSTLTVTGSPITTTGTLDVELPTTGVTAGAYTNSNVTVDAYGRITNISNGTAGGSTSETVVFKYTSGGAGNLTGVDAIVSQTSGVTTTITDGTNCLVEFSFTGKTAPPTSVTIYGQVYAINKFAIITPPSTGAALANFNIAGGGTSASPDLANSIFSSSNVITLQLRMSDTGSSAGLGQRAHAVVRFGF